MKTFLCTFFATVTVFISYAQPSLLESQRSNIRVVNAIKTKEDTLKKQFEKAGLQWPPKQLYMRSFKYDSQLEVWARDDNKSAFKLFKTYKVCALSGSLGPKRMEGDYQVPEGFYYINVFNPKSTYHMSLGINYPNASDAMLSDSAQPGADIYIHGSCITVGCIPIMDSQIEEVYLLASHARNNGEDFIPVHIFPIRYNNPKSVVQLEKATKDDKDYQQFSQKVKTVFDYFEQNKKLPIISVNAKGEYVIL
jgi:murein L,D-transpeptidase YafK